MKFFSRNPEESSAQISITLDPTGPAFFHPGSHLSGTVVLTVPAEKHLVYAEVIFFGHAETHGYRTEQRHNAGTNINTNTNTNNTNNTRTIYYKDDACLFRYSRQLTREMFVVTDVPSQWRFDFQYPYETQLIGESPYPRETESSGIYTNLAHALPPSFLLDIGSSSYAKVEYIVQAVFQFEGEKYPQVVQLPPLSLAPLSQGPHQPRLVEFTKPSEQYASSRLLEGVEKSFRGSFKDKFSSHTPSVNLALKASVPTLLDTASAFPIYVCAEVDSPSTTAVTIPKVNIRITKLTLCQYTFYRAVSERNYSSYRTESQFTHEDLLLLNALPDTLDVMQRDRFDGVKNVWFYPATFEARTPGTTCPSFRTFNINHNYQIEMKVEIEVCGKSFEFKIEVPDVVVLPAATAG